MEFFDPELSEEEDRFLRKLRKQKLMKKEYDLKKLKRRPGTPKSDAEAAKVPISIRLDGSVLARLKTEADRLGMPYQTYIGSVLYRFARGE